MRQSMRIIFTVSILVVLVPWSAAHAATGDAVVGQGAAGSATFDINATSGPSGENPTGYMNFNLAIGTVLSDVTHVCVNGNEAVVTGVAQSGSTAVAPGSGVALHVRDNGVQPTQPPDLLRLQLEGFQFAACPPFDLISPAGVTQGDITVTDGQPGFTFTGFFQPVDNNALNVTSAGGAIPVRFSLGGDQGLAIFAAGYPTSQRIDCDTSLPQDQIEETVTAGGSSLSYDPTTDQYTYVWKTDKRWAGTCRQLIVRFTDGTERTASFKFR
jgi:hypothetical protein